MDQKQLDDLQEPLDSDDFSTDEFDQDSEEKLNDVSEILENKDIIEDEEEINEETEVELQPQTPPANKDKKNPPEPQNNFNWDDDENETKSGSGWKYFSGLLILLLIAAVYTHGFASLTGAVAVPSLTQIEAEDKVLDYVNNNLLQPPFTAVVVSSEDIDTVFQVTLDVAGQEVESYVTKDGKYFFPQGFDLTIELFDDLDSPASAPVDISVDDDPMKGDPNAPVTIIEFSEFQCPFCKKYIDETYFQIIKNYVDTGKVRYVFRDFPLSFHEFARPAAMAAECAHEQGKFWEYHDLLFTNQAELSEANFKKWATELKLNTVQFNTCLDTEKYSDEVAADQAEGQSYGVSGTPAFFINGQIISGAQPYSVFQQAIEQALDLAVSSGIETETEENTVEDVPAIAEADPVFQDISITAKKWRFDPKHPVVKKGDKVRFIINGEIDIEFNMPAFGIKKEILAGEQQSLEFVAAETGTFAFTCGEYCIEKYGELQGSALQGELVVE